jgi:hypothetical protein
MTRALLCVATALAAGAASGQEFRAGAATSNITPFLGASINGSMSDIKAAHIHDELLARCLVLDDGQKRLAFAICDSCAIPLKVVEDAKGLITRATSIPPENVLIAATHSHSAACAVGVFQSEPDPDYLQFLSNRIADGVTRAVNNLEPARVGWGVVEEPEQLFNRRWRMKPGSIPPDPFGATSDQVQMNPQAGSPHLVEPAGPIDPALSILWVEAPGNRDLALLANYGLHYVGGVGPGHVSADYFGYFAREIERLLESESQDPPFVAMMSNGTSGDVNNINFRAPGPRHDPYEKMQLVASELAVSAAEIQAKTMPRDKAKLDARMATIELKVRKPSAEEIDRAETILAAAGGIEGPLRTLEQIYARETVLLSRFLESVPVSIQALRIGELGIVAIPCEVFAEIGLEIKKRSPFKPTFVIELANGYNGYLPTRAQHALGGYETWRARSSYLEVDAAEKITAKALELLEAVRGEP